MQILEVFFNVGALTPFELRLDFPDKLFGRTQIPFTFFLSEREIRRVNRNINLSKKLRCKKQIYY